MPHMVPELPTFSSLKPFNELAAAFAQICSLMNIREDYAELRAAIACDVIRLARAETCDATIIGDLIFARRFQFEAPRGDRPTSPNLSPELSHDNPSTPLSRRTQFPCRIVTFAPRIFMGMETDGVDLGREVHTFECSKCSEIQTRTTTPS